MGLKKTNRIALGNALKAIRKGSGLSAYAVAKKGEIAIGQVKAVEEGNTNYTIDVWMGYLSGIGVNYTELVSFFYESTKKNSTQLTKHADTTPKELR